HGVAHGLGAIAGADGDHAARERLEAALLATAIDDAAEGSRAVPQLAQQRPHEDGDPDHDRENDDGAENRRLDLIALPQEHHLARPVGKPRKAGREQADADEIQDEADHCLASFGEAAGAAPSDDLSWRSIVTMASSTDCRAATLSSHARVGP